MGKWMTIDNKRELIRKHAATPAMTQAQLAKWAKKEFRLRDPPARNPISDLLRNAGTIMKEAYGQGKRRKPLKVKAPALKRRLEDWIEKAEQRGLSFAIVQDMEKRAQLSPTSCAKAAMLSTK
ncbi:hypothetical protein PR003_g32215 [Phytophthora rubi]|uniref:HTH CENPB-type domain-containing protein n=2 Tax=Phytophthora rubi TaxID=129364 RepID=A0A6A4AYT9_9STRA|nr:hypothetical protein PR003_g32215 [Phytophthora rubi]